MGDGVEVRAFWRCVDRDLVRTAVAYWLDRVVIVRCSDWRDYPREGVLWVDVTWFGWGQRLCGRDNFWVHGSTFGMYNDPHNLHWYGGDPTKQAEAWRALPTGSILIDPPPPSSAHVLRGVLVPDGVWEEVSRANPILLA